MLTVPEAYRQIAHNISLVIFVRLDDDTWRGGKRRRFISEIRLLTRAIENDRPVTHLVYQAVAAPNRPAGYFPPADLEAELQPFRRDPLFVDRKLPR